MFIDILLLVDWNKDFQALLQMPDSEVKFKKLYHLAHDFVYAARAYAKIIISELTLPDELKTIQPADIGGIAGGTKFIVQVCAHFPLFKMPLDTFCRLFFFLVFVEYPVQICIGF